MFFDTDVDNDRRLDFEEYMVAMGKMAPVKHKYDQRLSISQFSHKAFHTLPIVGSRAPDLQLSVNHGINCSMIIIM